MKKCCSAIAWLIGWVRRAAVVVGLCIGASLALSVSAEAQSTAPPPVIAPPPVTAPPLVTYCEFNDVAVCRGPSTIPSDGISGSMQRQIQQRLEQLRCKGSNDPACVGGAAADSVSYEGLGIFISGGLPA